MSDAAPATNADTSEVAARDAVKPLKRWQLWLLPALFLLCAGMIIYAWWTWHHWTATERPKGDEVPSLQLCWRIAAAGAAAAFILAAVIGMLNRLEAYPLFRRWFFCIPNGLLKRLLLIVQICAMGLALYVLGVHYLGLKVVVF